MLIKPVNPFKLDIPLQPDGDIWFLGGDPGKSGAFAITNQLSEVISAIKMDATEQDIWRWISTARANAQNIFALMEKVTGMPTDGRGSLFKFGISYGIMRMAIVASQIPFEERTSSQWQRELRIPKRGSKNKTQHKNVLKRAAQNRFPQCKVTHAVADALLLSDLLRRIRMGELD